MSVHLKHIQNWAELAREANWSVSTLATRCGISQRTLQRYFVEQFGKTPKAWLLERRLELGIELLRGGSIVKEVAAHVGYKHSSDFSRAFKNHFEYTPAACPTETLHE